LANCVASILAATLGLTAFSLSLGLSIANPWHTAWVLTDGDHRIHFLGWHMFRHESWRSPPGAIYSFGYPVGTSIAYTDSIPLIAFPLKLATPILNGDFQYLGLWLLLSHVLQGFVAVLLLRTQTTNPVLLVLGAAMFVMSPALIFRYGHPALTPHWILLACLWVYFSNERWRNRLAGTWAAIAVIAAAIHPYIAFMVGVLAGAAHARLALTSPWRARAGIAASLVLTAALFALVFWANGYFVVGDSENIQGVGFGYFSMNVLAPIMSREGSTFWHSGPFSYATTGQYEGYMYLGTGTLILTLLVVAAAPLRWPTWRPRRRHLQHLPLLLACALLLGLALSNKVTAGETTVLEYNADLWGPLTLFRASGRLFWPVLYLLVFGVVAAIVKWFRPVSAALVLSFAVVVQAVDLYEPYKQLTLVRERAWTTPLRSRLWTAAARHYQHLTLIPTNMCFPPQDAIDYTPFALLAGNAGITVNGGFAARYDLQKLIDYCRDAVPRWHRGEFADDQLYVLKPGLAQTFLRVSTVPIVCSPVDDYVTCFTARSYVAWQDEYDIARERLPSREELARFRDRLDAIYRDQLKRPRGPSVVPPADSTEWIAQYLARRVAGCDHDRARSIIEAQLAKTDELRLCRTGLIAVHPVPPPNETFEFRRDLDRLYARYLAQPARAESSVDPEGEAVWIQEYARLRIEGRTAEEAEASVQRSIRAAAGL
jgi:hypothetical protein